MFFAEIRLHWNSNFGWKYQGAFERESSQQFTLSVYCMKSHGQGWSQELGVGVANVSTSVQQRKKEFTS